MLFRSDAVDGEVDAALHAVVRMAAAMAAQQFQLRPATFVPAPPKPGLIRGEQRDPAWVYWKARALQALAKDSQEPESLRSLAVDLQLPCPLHAFTPKHLIL